MIIAIGRELLWWILWPVDWLACVALTQAGFLAIWLGCSGVERIGEWWQQTRGR